MEGRACPTPTQAGRPLLRLGVELDRSSDIALGVLKEDKLADP